MELDGTGLLGLKRQEMHQKNSIQLVRCNVGAYYEQNSIGHNMVETCVLK